MVTNNRALHNPDYYRSINITEVIRASFLHTIDQNRVQCLWIILILIPLVLRDKILELLPSLSVFTYDIHSSLTLLVVLVCGAQILSTEWDRRALTLHVDGYFLKVASGWLTVNRASIPLNSFMMVEIKQTKPQMALGYYTLRIIGLNNPELNAFKFPWLTSQQAYDLKDYITWNINRLSSINAKARQIDKKVIDKLKEEEKTTHDKLTA